MRKLLSLTILAFALSACQQSASSLVVVNSNLDNYAKKSLHWGDPVNIEIEGSLHDSIQLSLNGEKMAGNNFTLDKSNSVLGKNRLKLTVYNDAEITVREVSLMIASNATPEKLKLSIVKTYKHDGSYFTEGFYYKDGLVYEGTGLNGQSKLVSYRLEDGKIVKSINLEDQFFGEGIAIVGDSIFQLTYKAQKAFVYNAGTFDKIGEFNVPFSAEGWGLCYDGEKLIMSNGSNYLYFINPRDFSVHGSLQVVDDRGGRDKLNELEYYNGKVYCNLWYEKEIVVIDPATGAVEQVISLDAIPAKSFQQGVPNGIAIKDGNLLITGKNWTETYEVQLEGAM